MAENQRELYIKASRNQRSPQLETPKHESAGPQLNTSTIVQETISGDGPVDADKMLHLQHTIGNRAVGQVLSRREAAIQAKLTVGAADDVYEREAEQVSSQVMRMSVDASPSAVTRWDDPAVQRKAADLSGSFEASHNIEQQLAANSGGSTLPARLRSELEPKFGADFSNVRVHTGAHSDSLNHKLSAQAFTYGNHIYLADGKYNPSSIGGQHLLAHELTHVMQQNSGLKRRVQRYPATALKNAKGIDWARDTINITRPGEGASGGVYFFTGGPPLTEIVVKPEYHFEGSREEARTTSKGQSSFGTDVLKATGVSTPDTRIVSTTEMGQIVAASHARGNAIPTEVIDQGDRNTLSFIRIMGKSAGKSISSEAKKVTTRPGLVLLISRLSDVALMRQVGKMIAIDAFMDMTDRIRPDMLAGGSKANLGNIMFAPDIATAIDNDSNFQHLQRLNEAGVTTQYSSMVALFTNRNLLINAFFVGVGSYITDEPVKQAWQAFVATNGDIVQKWKAALSDGMNEGIAALRALFVSRNKRSLKKQAKSWTRQGAERTSWEAFREAEKVFNLLDVGEHNMANVTQQLKQYRLYRQARAKRRFGFKWMTSKTKVRNEE